MDYAVVSLVALLAAALTFFSGFGLGTLLMPALAFFMPLPVAVAATAVVHLANNLFKLALVGRHASRDVLIRFALPAILAAFAGAWLLELFASRTLPLTTWTLGAHTFEITLLKLVIALIMLGFAVLELWPGFSKWSIDARWLPLGGVISGFFGGLSGHQGALRSAFLARSGLSKESFIGTGVVAAVAVDLARLFVYVVAMRASSLGDITRQEHWGLVAAASAAALAGSLLGARLIEKVTLRGVRLIVGLMLAAIGLALGAGLI